MLHAIVHPADIQDRDGGGMMLNTLFGRFPFLTKLFADGGYQGPVFAGAVTRAMPGLSVEIVKRSDAARGFEVLPKRWVVERSLGRRPDETVGLERGNPFRLVVRHGERRKLICHDTGL